MYSLKTGFQVDIMNPYITTILCAAGFILILAILILRNEHQRKKYFLRMIRRIYGQVPDREYEAGDLERISHYYQKIKGDGFVIDDITWNDLDMDRIYMLLNQTVSSPGEDVLYAMLRKPLFSQEEVEKREKLIDFFSTDVQKREKIQMLLSTVGKTRLGSLADTIFAINDAPKASLGIHLGMLAAMAASLAVLPLLPVYGFLLFIALGIINMVIYQAGKDHKILEIYLDSFGSLLRMLTAADEMETVSWPEVSGQMEAIRRGKKAFTGLRKRAFFLTGANSGTDDFFQAILDYVRMVFHIDILLYNSVLKEVQGKTDVIIEMLDAMGELDACISVASFREILPLSCRPEFISGQKGQAADKAELQVEDLYHPLIAEPVANSMRASGGILVTGSNASGKSTFLKNIAINTILAQTVCTCTCSKYRAPFMKVMTSMALRDDLSGGESYFMVEIRSLKRILDESKKPEPLLCIIDEVLRGTNTIERIAASSRILYNLAKPHVLPFAATHDIELSYILEGSYSNYHFSEEITDHEVVFNYLLKKGRATTRNAIRLLDMLGYDPELVRAAKAAATEFEQTGIWEHICPNG